MSDYNFKKQSEVRQSPLQDAVRVNLVLEKKVVTALKMKAVTEETTVNEIIRVLVNNFLEDSKDVL